MKIDRLPGKLLLQNVEILDPFKGKQTKGSLLIVNGKIAEIGKFELPSDVKSIDCEGLVLTHGFCDLSAVLVNAGSKRMPVAATSQR